MNRGLSDELKAVFTNITPVVRPLVQNLPILDPHWLAGFVSGEGCFFINTFKSKTRLGMSIKLTFILTQHARDELLMRSLIEYYGCGNIYKTENAVRYRVEKF